MRSVIASPCCTRARSGRWEPWSKSSRRRIPWSGSSLRDAPGEARERVRRRPRRDRGVRGRGRRRLVALGCPHRPDGGGLHRPVPDRRRSERRGPGRPAWSPRRPRGGNPARQRKLGRGGPEDLRRHAATLPSGGDRGVGVPVRRVGRLARFARPAPERPEHQAGDRRGAGGGSGKWPGATLPDIGQLTAQASRIATDIATVSNRIQTAFDSEAVNELRRSIKDFGRIADRLVQVTNEQADVIGSVGTNLREGSQAVAKAATQVQATLGRVDSATNQGQLATILNNSAEASSNMRSASQDFRDLLDAAHKNQESLVRVLVSADSVMSRIANRSGTLGLLVSDSTLYRETTLTMIQLRQLLSDIQANPRKYFSFSVF